MTTPAPTPAPEPAATPGEELALLGQIVRRVERLSDASKRWFRDRLIADLSEDEF